MKRNEIFRGRFSSPAILTENTVALGVPAKTWSEAFTGNMDKTLVELEQRVRIVRGSVRDTSNQSPE